MAKISPSSAARRVVSTRGREGGERMSERKGGKRGGGALGSEMEC